MELQDICTKEGSGKAFQQTVLQEQDSISNIDTWNEPTLQRSKIKTLLVIAGVQVFNIGPDFSIFLPTIIALTLILQTAAYFVRETDHLAEPFKILVTTVSVIQNLSYLLAGLVNPGVVRKNQRQSSSSEELRKCQVCNLYCKQTTYHCEYCQRCIKGYDHHCPWVGKCIGSGNFLLFVFFVFSTIGSIMLTIVALILVVVPTDKN